MSSPCNTPLRPLIRLDGRSERPPPINRLVTSSPSTYMIFPTLLPLWQAPTLFIIWVLEGGGCGSTCPGNDVKLYLMVRFQFWRFGECGAPLHHHCSFSLALDQGDCFCMSWSDTSTAQNLCQSCTELVRLGIDSDSEVDAISTNR